MTLKLVSVSVAALLLSACNMAPDLEQRELPVAQNYDVEGGEGDINALHWQTFFSNDQLQQLIQLTFENNKDIQTAALNVQQVRAMYQIEDSNLYPSIDLNASGTRQRLPADLSNTGQATITEQYSATVGLTAYELDLWGKVRNQSEQALQNLYSAEYSLTSVRISLISELVNAWLNYATDKALLALANDTLKSQQESLELTRKTFALGAASQLTLSQLESTVATAKVDIANYQRLLKRDKNALDFLVGKTVSADLLPSQSIDTVLNMPEVPVGLPSELLTQQILVLRKRLFIQALV